MKLPASQTRATVSDTSVNEESRTVDLIWTTGSKGMRSYQGQSYFEELSLDPKHVDMSRLQEGAPLLAAHDDSSLDSVIGVVESASVDGNVGRATVRFAKDERSERIFQKVKDKILRNVSVGYSVTEYTNVSESGDEVPTMRATRWQPAEISIVPIGFDAGARTRNNESLTENEVEVIELRSETHKEETEMSDTNKPAVDTEALKLEAAKAERQRASGITKAVRAANLQETLAEDMIERGLSLEEAVKNVEAFKRAIEASKVTEVASTVRVEVGSDNSDKRREAFEEALLHRVDSRNFKVTEEGKALYGKSLLRQIETFIPRYTMESDAQFAKRAMVSADLPLALANVAEKSLQKSYTLAPRSFTAWTKSDTLRNYKQHSQVRSGDFASLVARSEGADFSTGTVGEERELVTLADYGIIHGFSSQMLVNDDLGVLAKLATQGGVAAARLENKLAYAALTANKTMNDTIACYHASHGNLGTAGVVEQASIAQAYKMMRKQTSADTLDPLNLTPKFLICGPDQEVSARVALAAISPTLTSSVNIFQNTMEVIVDAEITGNQYYFAADPSVIDTINVYRLEGQESPTVESRIKFENNSLELKVAHAVAASAMDWRGLVKNAGQS